jgi:hypothetical protein
MGLTELTENDEAFFLEGHAHGWVYKENSRDLVLQKPIWGAIEGSALNRFFLERDKPTLKVEYINSVSGKLMSLELGEVKDREAAESWIERVNRLYENQQNHV